MPETGVAVAAVIAGIGLRMLSCAEPDTLGEATLTAVMVTVFEAGIVAGGVYTPAVLMVPTVLLPPGTPSTCHVTAVLVMLLTAAVKLAVVPSRTWLPPLTVTDGWFCIGLEPVLQPARMVTKPSTNTRRRCEWGNCESCKADLRDGKSSDAGKGKADRATTLGTMQPRESCAPL